MTNDPDRHTAAQRVLRMLADRSTMIIWEADIEGRCTYLNPESMTGLQSPGEVNIFDWAQMIHPEDFPRVSAVVREAREKRREYMVEYRVQRSDGSMRWMMGTGSPRVTRDGTLAGYFGTIVDISERHEAQNRLARSEAEHRLLTESARDLISHSDADNRYTYVSPSHKDTLGYEPQELIGTHLYDYIHPDDVKAPPPERNRPRGLMTIRFRHKDGHWVWLAASTRTIRDPQTGQKTGIVSVARDITTQLEAQRELARREERFRSLTSLSSDWYWETDADIRFTFFSEGMSRRLGIDPQSLIGSSFYEHVRQRNEPGFVACMESVAARQPFHDLIYPAESLTHPGIVRYLRISGEPIFEEGEFRGYRGVTRDVTRDVRTARTLERLATIDSLTELPNRAQFEAHLKERISQPRHAAPFAVFFIDLDNFKEVNDSLGHGAGDVLLRAIAARLKHCVRPEDVLARLGGDEFVVVAECAHAEQSAAALADKLCTALDEPMIVEGHEVRAGASIGISMYPRDAGNSEALLQNADIALYRAKAAGGRGYCFFTPEMGAATRSRLTLQSALRHALQRGELEIHYQPRVRLRTLELTGMEALLRWNHPEMGAVAQAQFIPLAEETGLIDDIGAWVLREATLQTQRWVERYGRPLHVSVNLAARQLRNAGLTTTVVEALAASRLPPQLLELELTETGLMEDPELAARLLQELHAKGITLSVDDFGTGYSSLAYLRRFPLDKLKLDRSFLLQKHADQAAPWKLAEAIINLAHALNLAVVAEGVETKAHFDFLRNTSCDEIQGFCISEPLPAARFEQLLAGGLVRLPLNYPAHA